MRLKNIDLLRGIVMILMCIDHARDYTHFHPTDPMNLADTSLSVYILRILAHFCAPTFILLAGMSMRLAGKNKTPKELSKFLFVRGSILCLLEITLVNWAWSYNPTYHLVYLQVIWAIGISMMTLGLLIHLKDKYILGIALFIIAGHNLLQDITFPENSAMHYVWSFLLQKNVLSITEHLSVRTTYPVLPVIAIMALGYILGKLYTQKDSVFRRKKMIQIGISCLFLFFLFRLFIGYGDPYPLQVFDNLGLTIMSIFNVTKYPMSFQFVLLSLSGTFLFLGLTDKKAEMKTNFIITFGQVPMFFYILHIYILHAIALIIVIIEGYPVDLNKNLGGIPPNFGFPLWFLWWIIPLTLAILYPLCKKYKVLKQSKKYKFTSYI